MRCLFRKACLSVCAEYSSVCVCVCVCVPLWKEFVFVFGASVFLAQGCLSRCVQVCVTEATVFKAELEVPHCATHCCCSTVHRRLHSWCRFTSYILDKMRENTGIEKKNKKNSVTEENRCGPQKRQQDLLLSIVLRVGKGSRTFFFFFFFLFLGKSCSAVTSGRGRGKAINGKCSRSIFNNLGQSLWRKSQQGRGELLHRSPLRRSGCGWRGDEQACMHVCV